jgi:hypothetical protein
MSLKDDEQQHIQMELDFSSALTGQPERGGTPQGGPFTPRTQKITCCRGIRFRVVGGLAGVRSGAVRGGNGEAVPDGNVY